MTKTEVLLVLVLFALVALWSSLSRVASLLEAWLKAQAAARQSEQERQLQDERRAHDLAQERQARERHINACPLCNGERVYYGRACVYCLGYGEARRSDEAEKRFTDWTSEVRRKWASLFGMPF